MQQHAWIINHFAQGRLEGTELEWVERSVPDLQPGDVLIRTLMLTLDPSNLLWLSEEPDYLPQLEIGDVMRGLVLGRVEQSRHPGHKVGDLVFALLGWQQYAVVRGEALTPVEGAVSFHPHPDIPLEAYVSALGPTGWSAYVGMRLVGEVGEGDAVLVSGAAGATGLQACQIAKACGARVVGVAGGEKKCAMLQQELGIDGCIDYKATDDLSAAMARAFPDGIDLYFDNVGGPMLDAALENMALRGRIVISGSISQYQSHGDREKLYGVRNTFMLASKRLRMEGFLILDYLDRTGEFMPQLESWLLSGALRYRNTLVQGLENAQAALPRLFSGDHLGKLVIDCR
ncbi:NADP-dependent oxidoreductase [Marinobacterium nitratireducens]|uniref:NADP-dependent oxidoreductase n=1 Tax=Marinobacterium nitratireducens TaxID=518897 RepID=A0A918DXQ0_9GAMM|nr:NADP-dependent oxidoreductase [Marinobacterium nitratireducens]GGO88933.1 NADP-dependent oxidoreductase [Marinobacterium nitratireducens]